MGKPQGWSGCFGKPDLQMGYGKPDLQMGYGKPDFQMGYGYSCDSSRWGTGC